MTSRRKILVADDNADNRRIIIFQLQRLGEFELSEATDGFEVLDVVERDRPDLVVLDLRMPRMNGWETLRRLGDTPERATFRVLAISAGGMPDSEPQVRMLGADAYLTGIFADAPQFRRIVQQLLVLDE